MKTIQACLDKMIINHKNGRNFDEGSPNFKEMVD